jgi:hypothetical protein
MSIFFSGKKLVKQKVLVIESKTSTQPAQGLAPQSAKISRRCSFYE